MCVGGGGGGGAQGLCTFVILVLVCMVWDNRHTISSHWSYYKQPTVYNNNRELIERLQILKVLYNLKKNIQCTNTHNYSNQ